VSAQPNVNVGPQPAAPENGRERPSNARGMTRGPWMAAYAWDRQGGARSGAPDSVRTAANRRSSNHEGWQYNCHPNSRRQREPPPVCLPPTP